MHQPALVEVKQELQILVVVDQEHYLQEMVEPEEVE